MSGKVRPYCGLQKEGKRPTQNGRVGVLSQARPVYVSLHERKQDRTRWVQGLTVQTIDPEIE